MAEDRNEFHRTTTSGFMLETDLWTLVTDTISGALSVEHKWSYVDPFGNGKPDRGLTVVTVENFLMGRTDDGVKQKLRAILLGRAAPK